MTKVGRDMTKGGRDMTKGAPGKPAPEAPSASYDRLCQPFLMRLVSSVTWL
jgi:hypothetical protein